MWLRGCDITVEGDEFVVTQSQKKPCDDSIHGKCPHRVGAAFAILNAVRDGSRRYLDSPSGTLSAAESTSTSSASLPSSRAVPDRSEASFESSFPSLQTLPASTTPTLLVGRKKKKKQPTQVPNHPHANNFPLPKSGAWAISARGGSDAPTKTDRTVAKRRIRPVSTASLSSSPWGSAATSGLQQSAALKGNIASLPSEDPALVRKPPRPPDVPEGKSSKHSAVRFGECKPSVVNDKTTKECNVWGGQSKSSSVVEQPKGPNGCISADIQTVGNVKSSREVPEHDAKSLRERAIAVYVEVIQNLLSPSVPLELHLLIRMISVDVSKKFPVGVEASTSDGQRADLKHIFSSGLACRRFACEVLSRLKLIVINLGHEIIKSLVALPVLADVLPSLLSDLKLALDRSNDDLMLESSHMVVNDTIHTSLFTSKVANFTVPFDENRDSRHNYRSRDQTMLFSNREESRDKFMYQLRAFQEIRGTVVDPSQADMYIDEIKKSCQEMVRSLKTGNSFWFAEFFCDLLLQIGLVPMEETDKEMLKNVDKERLKKLHRRFTSKGSQKSKSSQKLSLERKDQAVSTAQGHFSGHQEFFYIFLLAVDSHSFGVHLRRRIVGLITEMSSAEETKAMEDRVAKMQLLAKFLGMLTFSPNWSTVYEDPSSSTNLALSTASKDALAQLNCTVPIIPLRKYIERAWRDGHLLVIIPWVVEFLRMATWDSLSIEANYYQDVFCLLRSIHRKISQRTPEDQSSVSSNMLLVSFQLETLFAAVVGLSKCENFADMTLPLQKEGTACPGSDAEEASYSRARSLDALPFRFSKSFLFSASSHLEELHKLIVDLTHRKRSCNGPGTPKKLRPYAVNADKPSDLPSKALFPAPAAFVDGNEGQRGNQSISQGTQLFSQSESDIRGKLVGTFFHQHRDLQELCEFIVGWSVKNVLSTCVKEHITPRLEANAAASDETNLDSFVKKIRAAEKDIITDACHLMKEKTADSISESMRILCPPSTSPEVGEIAITLAIQASRQSCDALVNSMVRMEVKKRVDEFAKKMTKAAAAKEAAQKLQNGPAKFVTQKECSDSKTEATGFQEELECVASALKHLATTSPERRTALLEESCQTVLRANSSVLEAIGTRCSRSDKEQNVVVKRFGEGLKSLLHISFSKDKEQCYLLRSVILASFSLIVSLRKAGFVHKELIENCIYLCEPVRLELMLNWSNDHGNKGRGVNEVVKELGVMLVDFVSVRLISAITLERSLIGILEMSNKEQLAVDLAFSCLQRLCGNARGSSSDEIVPSMPKLRRMVCQ